MVWIAASSGCGAPREPVVVALRTPPLPVLPRITADELACLPADVYRRLLLRDDLRREDELKLRALLDAARGVSGDGR